MSAPAHPDTETTDISELDFELRCDVRLVKSSAPNAPLTNCEEPARYIVTAPCCGVRVFSCETHAHDGRPWWCPGCRHKFYIDTSNLVRI